MDVSIDTTVFSRVAEHPDDLAEELISKVMERRCRLVVTTTLLDELFSDSKYDRACLQARMFCRLSDRLRSRFVIAGGLADIVNAERAAALSSTPSIPKEDRQTLLRHLGSPELLQNLPAMAPGFRSLLGKDLTHSADQKARAAGAIQFSKFEAKDLDVMLRIRDGRFLWESQFVELAEKRGIPRQALRERSSRYRTALTFAAYAFMNATGSLFGKFSYGKWAGILKAPRRGDWVDGAIAACAAHSKAFLTEDDGQRKRTAYIWQQFGYRIEVLSLRSWLSDAGVVSNR
jgi:hypothetical protein